jgi:hypothetical protein
MSSFTKEQEEFLGGADRTDPYILARMRSKFPDAPKAKEDSGELRDETGEKSKIRRNTETGELYSTEASFKPVPKNVSTSSQPARSTPAKSMPISKSTVEDKDETGKSSDIRRNPETGEMYNTKDSGVAKKTTKSTVPADFGKVSLPKSFSESGGSTEPKKSTAKLSPVNLSLPDPLSRFKKSKGDKDPAYKDAGYKKGGMVSSASKRADGCAIRGKTRA